MNPYILLILLYAVACQEYVLNFNETPSDVSVTRYQNIFLKCKADGETENVRYHWKQNGRKLMITGRRRLENGNLLIKRANETQDVGKYVCELEHLHTGKKIESPVAVVEVHWLESNLSVVLVYPQFVSEISSKGEIKLQCLASGSAELRIDWFRNGERITKADRISIDNDLLHVNRITPNDNGVYRCSASNKAGSVLSLKNFALAVQNDSWATIQVIPEDKFVKEGTSARIDCVYRNADVVEWYFEEKMGPLNNSTRFTILTSNNSLFVNNMTKVDEGLYACVGVKQSSANVPQKYTAHLYVAVLASMNSSYLEPEESYLHVVPEGRNFEIKCYPPFGKPPPLIKWKNPSGQLIENYGRVRVEGYTLSVNRANLKSDAGTYTCRAENVAGFQEVAFNLVVAVPPVIKKQPISKRVDEGVDVIMSCEFTGTPYPISQVIWFKDETPVPINSSRTYIDVANGTLQLSHVEPNDAGNYYCIVNTTSFPPVKSLFAALNVEQTLKFHPLPMGKKMELGMPNKIPCKAEGKDVPFVKWVKLNSKNESTAFPKHIQDVNGTLYFTKVQKQDEGQYMCVASNSQGEIRVVIDVNVVVTPKFIILPKNPTEGFEGSSVRLDCGAEGDPAPTIQWDNKNVDFSQKRFHMLSNGSLLIDELRFSDEGYYGCTAGNSGGFNRTEVTLIVRSSESLRSDGTVDGIEGDTVGKTVVITLGAACAYILLVIVLMAWCRYRRRKKKQSYMEANTDNTNMDEDAGTGKYSLRNPVELKETVVIQNGDSVIPRDDRQSTNSSSDRSKHLADGYEHLNFSRKNIHNIMLLGNGEFGSVYLAQNSQDANTIVMVKVLEEVKEEFTRQLDILIHTDHEHFVKLLGLCRETQPHYMILEYTDWGDLKQFLIATRKSSIGVVGNKERPTPLTLKQSLNIARQVASVLEYLSCSNYTHRNVAARNCLIMSSLNIKLTFSSLCKTTYATEYYVINNQTLPIRWLPFEAISDNVFTTSTDVYSFACLVWEIFTKGELPFSKLSNKDFISLLEKQQIQWKLPKSVPSKLNQLMHKCWSLSPTDRPTFSQIELKITELMNLVNDE